MQSYALRSAFYKIRFCFHTIHAREPSVTGRHGTVPAVGIPSDARVTYRIFRSAAARFVAANLPQAQMGELPLCLGSGPRCERVGATPRTPGSRAPGVTGTSRGMT